jgi:hypothetical protein
MTTSLHPAAGPGNPWIAGIRPADYGLVAKPTKDRADFAGSRQQNPQGPQGRMGIAIAAAPATIQRLNERPPDALARQHHSSEALALSDT